MSVDWRALVPYIAHEVRTLARKGLSNAQLVERILGPARDGEIRGHLQATIESQIDLNLSICAASFIGRFFEAPLRQVDSIAKAARISFPPHARTRQ